MHKILPINMKSQENNFVEYKATRKLKIIGIIPILTITIAITATNASSPLPRIQHFPKTNLSKCGIEVTCIRSPPQCESLASCEAVAVVYASNETHHVVQLITIFPYIAIVQTHQKYPVHQAHDDVITYCEKGRPSKFGSFHGTSALSGFDKGSGMRSGRRSVRVDEDGVMMCTFERPLSGGQDIRSGNLHGLDMYAKLVYGKPFRAGETIYSLDMRRLVSTENRLDIRRAEIVVTHSGMLSAAQKIHGILMVVAFFFLAVTGTLSRSFKLQVFSYYSLPS